jgi:hypothetical protein
VKHCKSTVSMPEWKRTRIGYISNYAHSYGEASFIRTGIEICFSQSNLSTLSQRMPRLTAQFIKFSAGVDWR